MRRWTLAALVIGAGTLLFVFPPGHASAQGPRLAVLAKHSGGAFSELATVGSMGGAYRRLLPPPGPRTSMLRRTAGQTWSADGQSLAISHRTDRGRFISMLAGDILRVVPGTQGGVLPVLSPDGRTLAFSRQRERFIVGRRRVRSASVWTLDLVTGEQRRLTKWRDELWQYPSSFSPDGGTLLLVRMDYLRTADPEVVALYFDERTSGLLISAASFPEFSPDGSSVALVRWVPQRTPFRRAGNGKPHWSNLENAELFTLRADGSGLRRLTHTPYTDELDPAWDPSGDRVAYLQHDLRRKEASNAVAQINADGTCRATMLERRQTVFEAPEWQPGPGREAGPIRC